MKSIINKEKVMINKLKGGAGEACFKNEQELQGNEVTRTGIGSDYQIKGKNYEIKTGKYAKPTARQKKEIKKGKTKVHNISFNY